MSKCTTFPVDSGVLQRPASSIDAMHKGLHSHRRQKDAAGNDVRVQFSPGWQLVPQRKVEQWSGTQLDWVGLGVRRQESLLPCQVSSRIAKRA